MQMAYIQTNDICSDQYARSYKLPLQQIKVAG